ncbi:type II CAAX endopeptidase family protein [Hathewaya histolytica]|uniref:CAAX amino terminal protease family protein n=1 Tax=Hathewaya histolytica TaxID=1498 RepID=A0A4U9RDN8_HATHI|nr:type II CAAX endopeptidase family protein [Hathewaya histolytica]VTQ89148.1 CAAX amino terminal protease family protein [Hathewaya histolytica]
MENNKDSINQEGVSILENIFIFLFYMILSCISNGAISAFLERTLYFKPNIWIKLIESVLFIVMELLFIKFYKNYGKLHLDFKRTKNYKIYIWLSLIVIGYIWFYDNSIEIFLDSIIKVDLVDYAFKNKKGLYLIYISIYLSIFAPIFEEIIFRGLLFKGLLKRYDYLKAIIASSIFFAIIHGDIKQGINAFILGIILAIVYYRTNSLLPCIFLHFVNNFIYVLSLYGIRIKSSNFSLIELVIGALILISSYLIHKKIIKTEKEENVKVIY